MFIDISCDVHLKLAVKVITIHFKSNKNQFMVQYCYHSKTLLNNEPRPLPCTLHITVLNVCNTEVQKYTVVSQACYKCSEFWPFLITHFNTTVSPFVTGSEESWWDHVAGMFASPTLLLLRRSLSAQSSSVFYLVRVVTSVLYGMKHSLVI